MHRHETGSTLGWRMPLVSTLKPVATFAHWLGSVLTVFVNLLYLKRNLHKENEEKRKRVTFLGQSVLKHRDVGRDVGTPLGGTLYKQYFYRMGGFV